MIAQSIVVLALFAVFALAVVFLVRRLVRAVGKARALVLAALAVPFVIVGSTKHRVSVTWGYGLIDNGSTFTNDVAKLRWRSSVIPIVETVFVLAQPEGATNAWAQAGSSTVGAGGIDLTMPGLATNFAYWVFSDWTPPVPVHTNGVYRTSGWTRSPADTNKLITTLVGVKTNAVLIAPPIP